MRISIMLIPLVALIATSCNGAVVDRILDDENSTDPAPFERTQQPGNRPDDTIQPAETLADVSINGYSLSIEDLEWIEATYGVTVESGDYWYDPISGAWGFWGGPTAGFLPPYMELGYAPIEASGGGTGVVLNGRELHPQDLAGLQQLLGPIKSGYYWLDADGFIGYQGGPALGNLIYVAQGVGSNGGNGGYYDSTYFGNVGSDGQTSYFYDSSSGCSVMSDGGLSC